MDSANISQETCRQHTMHKELMKCFSSRNHRKNVFSLGNNGFHNDGSIVFKEFFHLGWKFFLCGNTHALDSHCICEFDEIGIHLSSMRVSLLVENVLPLLNHSIH